jgi:hypothetical protein
VAAVRGAGLVPAACGTGTVGGALALGLGWELVGCGVAAWVGRGRTTGLSGSTGPTERALGLAVLGGRLKVSCAATGMAKAASIAATAALPAGNAPDLRINCHPVSISPRPLARLALNRE